MKNRIAASAGAFALATMLITSPNATIRAKPAIHNHVQIRKSKEFVTCTDHFKLIAKNHPKIMGLLRVKTKKAHPNGPWYIFSIKFKGKDQHPNLTNPQMNQLSRDMDMTFKACKEKPWGIMWGFPK